MASKLKEHFNFPANSMKMPIVGLGTFLSSEEEIEKAIDAALTAGYRHIDTAFVYRNEAAIGKSLKKWFDSGKIKREELFIVTKLPPNAMNEKCVEKYLKKSLESLQMSYVDLYLLHRPEGLVEGEDTFPRDEQGNLKVDMSTDHVAIWKAMEAQVDAGRAKSIGVSNFSTRQIDRLLKIAQIPPANNQVEMHLYLQQKELQAWSKSSGVTLCAYSPFGSPGLKDFLQKSRGTAEGLKFLSPLSEPVVLRIAKAYNKTPAQILLRHLMQLGVAVIPKSVNPERIHQNFDVFKFELSPKDMDELNALDRGEDGRMVHGILKGLEVHPEYQFKEV